MAMPHQNGTIKDIEDLIKSAQAASEAKLGDVHISFPMPVRRADGMDIAFMCSISSVTGAFGMQLLPPHKVLLVDSATGDLSAIRDTSPAEFGEPHQPNQYIGAYEMPSGISRDEFVKKKAELYSQYNILLPAFASGVSRPSAEVRNAAIEFQKTFQLITEKPLAGYYRSLGKEFWNWLGVVSK